MKQKEPISKFVKVRCPKCKNEQVIFGSPSTEVKCLVCGEPLSAPTGGKGKLNKGKLVTAMK